MARTNARKSTKPPMRSGEFMGWIIGFTFALGIGSDRGWERVVMQFDGQKAKDVGQK
jgi:hypothetical protein